VVVLWQDWWQNWKTFFAMNQDQALLMSLLFCLMMAEKPWQVQRREMTISW